MNEIELWKMFASLGVPGVALGVFYFLFLKFDFKLPQVPVKWVGPVIVLFMLLSSSLTFYALTLWAPNSNKENIKGGNKDIQTTANSAENQPIEATVKIDQVTSGEKSPAVSNVTGNVKIEIDGD